jgi:CRP-like cAMP-binding protein
MDPCEGSDGVLLQPSSLQATPGKLSPDLLQALHGIKSTRLLSSGAMLFEQGTVAAGVYLVESGQIRVLLPTLHSNLQLLELVGPGGILGLSESMSDQKHRVSAQAVDEILVAFIGREDFREFLRTHSDFCMQVLRVLSEDLHGIYNKFRSISAHPGRPRHRALDEQLN